MSEEQAQRYQQLFAAKDETYKAFRVQEARKSILSLELSRSRLGGRGVGMPCPHGQGGDGWGPRQRG